MAKSKKNATKLGRKQLVAKIEKAMKGQKKIEYYDKAVALDNENSEADRQTAEELI